MPENNSVVLVWYELRTDENEYRITLKQKEGIMTADQMGKKFVDIGSAVINIAFIREMKRVERVRDMLGVHPLEESEKKYIFLGEQNGEKQLSSGNQLR